jgi:hypothetical protein
MGQFSSLRSGIKIKLIDGRMDIFGDLDFC